MEVHELDGTSSSGDAARSVAEMIHRTMSEVSAAERRVARAILSDYPMAGMEPAVKLAERAGVSAPTVTRYVSRLGFGGYKEFQQVLRDEINARGANPMTLPSVYTADTPASRVLSKVSRAGQKLLAEGFAALPSSEFGLAIDLTADPRLRVNAIGGRWSRLVAEYLILHLRTMRPDTQLLSAQRDEAGVALVELGRRDVVFVLDFRRYQDDVVDFARKAHQRDSKIVLITDVWLSPVAEFADVVLPLSTDIGSPYDSLVPAIALVEALAAAALARLGEDAQARMHLIEQVSTESAT